MPDEHGNPTIQEMRKALDDKDRDLNTFKTKATDLETKLGEVTTQLNELKKGQMDEITKLRHENGEFQQMIESLSKDKETLATVSTQLEQFKGFVTKQYEERIATVDEKLRENVKNLSFVEGDPVSSLSKLNDTLTLLGIKDSGKAGLITNPPGGPGPIVTDDKTIDPKKIKDMSWGNILKPYVPPGSGNAQ